MGGVAATAAGPRMQTGLVSLDGSRIPDSWQVLVRGQVWTSAASEPAGSPTFRHRAIGVPDPDVRPPLSDPSVEDLLEFVGVLFDQIGAAVMLCRGVLEKHHPPPAIVLRNGVPDGRFQAPSTSAYSVRTGVSSKAVIRRA